MADDSQYVKELSAPGHVSEAHVTLQEKPHQGQVFFPRQDGSALLHRLEGVAGEPVPSGNIVVQVSTGRRFALAWSASSTTVKSGTQRHSTDLKCRACKQAWTGAGANTPVPSYPCPRSPERMLLPAGPDPYLPACH